MYEILFDHDIKVGEGEAGWVITRSTLNRNGLFITSGLYDSGYHGVMAGALHVTAGPAKIRPYTRVGQFLLFKAQNIKMYDGDYGHAKQHDKIYDAQSEKTLESDINLDSMMLSSIFIGGCNS